MVLGFPFKPMIMIKYLSIAAVMLLMSCSQVSESVSGSGYSADSMVTMAPPPEMIESPAQESGRSAQPPAPDAPVVRKLIRNGDITVEVADVRAAYNEVKSKVAALGGYVSEDGQNNYGDGLSVTMRIRVPAERFDTLLQSVEASARRVESKSVSVSDVTAEFVDIEARMKTKYELEARYAEILKSARSVSEILEVEQALNNVRGEIESMEGRLKYLSDQVAMSSLSVVLVERITPRSGFWMVIGESFTSGWNGFLGFIATLVGFWPFFLLGAGIVWLFRRWRRRAQGD